MDIPPFDECAKAMQDRDAAYDGLFFIAVKTTGVYCRPVCRVRTPKVQNVLFVPSAAAAEALGYRPCLRCRPETAPFSPAWNGTLTTVTRALKLMADGALDKCSVAEFSDRLGVTDRHLRRLFAEHVGASPHQTAQTMRIQKAKRLLDTTEQPITQIAYDAGFQSVRTFNNSFKTLYGRSPSALRSKRVNRK